MDLSELRADTLTQLRRLRADDGAGYALTYTLAFPIVAMMAAIVLEAMLLMIAKQGTQYAAYAAARSAAVWMDAEPADLRQSVPEQAARRAMCGVASGNPYHGDRLFPAPIEELLLIQAFERASEDERLSQPYMRMKIRVAHRMTDVEISEQPLDTLHDSQDTRVTGSPLDRGAADEVLERTMVVARITYRAPIHVPVVGRLFGTRDLLSGIRYWEMRSEATMLRERPASESGTLGIDYESRGRPLLRL